MSNDAGHSADLRAQAGLPPVKPPSARFIIQLFLIPGLIVGGAVMVVLFGGLAWFGATTPDSFLNQLKNPNPDIRWRAAHELTQVLLRPEGTELAANPEFAIAVAEQLESAYGELVKAEAATKVDLEETFRRIDASQAGTSKEEKEDLKNKEALKAWVKLRAQRDLVNYLISSCGHFIVPVSVHVLGNIAMRDKGADVKGLALRRRKAVWALAELGNNIQQRYFDKDGKAGAEKLTGPQKRKMIDALVELSKGKDVRAKVAQYAFDVLEARKPSEVDKVLAVCALAEDIFLREEVAHAANFWDGPLIEPTLLQLSRDDGHGVLILVSDND